ncbi:MAG: hypothetical protein RSF35_01145 [Akkermansia sp.]
MYYHEYSLIAKGQLNARSENFRRTGVLILTDAGGYGCIHPWPELGDATLQEELDALRAGSPLPLGKRALECATVDAEARAKGVKLMDGLIIPDSHATIPPYVSPATVRLMSHHGFKAGKLKAMPNITSTRERLITLASMVPEWRWRLDFNASLELNAAEQFWQGLTEPLKEMIDFIEDPCSFTHESWMHLSNQGMPIACDLGSHICYQPKITTDIPMTRVIKPARERSPHKNTGKHIFTSMMDHPIGQLWACYCAASYYKGYDKQDMPLCGLCTHLLFQKDAFIEELGDLSPVINIPQGTGLGFDELLKKLDWKKL